MPKEKPTESIGNRNSQCVIASVAALVLKNQFVIVKLKSGDKVNLDFNVHHLAKLAYKEMCKRFKLTELEDNPCVCCSNKGIIEPGESWDWCEYCEGFDNFKSPEKED